jgi:hypothetical protein
LCAVRFADAYSNTYGYSNANSHCDGDGNANCFTNARRKSDSDAATSPDSGAETESAARPEDFLGLKHYKVWRGELLLVGSCADFGIVLRTSRSTFSATINPSRFAGLCFVLPTSS